MLASDQFQGGSMTSQMLRSLAEELTELVSHAAGVVGQVHVPGRSPTTGTLFKHDQVLVVGHTVASADRVRAVFGDRTVDADVVGPDGASDLALIKTAGLSIEPPQIRADLPRVGEPVAIVGRHRQGGPSASVGIIGSIAGPVRSAAGRIEQVIRIDASTFRGISGAAVIDADGQLVGIANGALQRGVAYAIPAQVAVAVAAVLAEHGRIKRGYLGIGSQPVRLPAAQRAGRDQPQGLLVVAVAEGGPAEAGGLLIGDVLVSFDRRPLTVPDDLLDLLTGERVNRPVPIEVIRGGTLMTLDITVGERNAR